MLVYGGQSNCPNLHIKQWLIACSGNGNWVMITLLFFRLSSECAGPSSTSGVLNVSLSGERKHSASVLSRGNYSWPRGGDWEQKVMFRIGWNKTIRLDLFLQHRIIKLSRALTTSLWRTRPRSYSQLFPMRASTAVMMARGEIAF